MLKLYKVILAKTLDERRLTWWTHNATPWRLAMLDLFDQAF